MNERELLIRAVTLLRRFRAFQGAGSEPHIKRQFVDLIKQIDKFLAEDAKEVP